MPPPQTALQHSKVCPGARGRVGEIPKASRPFTTYQVHQEKIYHPNERTEQSFRKRTIVNDEDKSNLPDGEFKALVIKMLTDLTELGRKMKKQMKDTQNEIKQKIREPTVTGRKPGLKAMIWNKREK